MTSSEAIELREGLLSPRTSMYPMPREKPSADSKPPQQFCSDSVKSIVCDAMWIGELAIAGVLLRVGLNLLFVSRLGALSSTSPLFADLGANALGCLIMGFLAQIFADKRVSATSFYVGCTTGLCGSLTTFSSWNQQMSLVMISAGGYSGAWCGALFGWALGFSVAFCSYSFGCDLAKQLKPPSASATLPTAAAAQTNIAVQLLLPIILLTATYVVLALLLALDIDPTRRGLWMASILGPFGALLRYIIGKILNPLSDRFFWGTFVVNQIACVISASVTQARYRTVYPFWVTVLFVGIANGFDGALSTVSSLIKEVMTLRAKSLALCLRYVLATTLTAMLTTGLINGVSSALLD
eukprot:TRINITY_DN14249_c0_g1_i1.p1 TRINITY_DN14249_c0_g1~~TRINITY_DN14249_c0_g1_i1.p1  ORF type:complete len:354 (+),score=48.02 TRINITY_DN14249_c0_g1_i1:49-1110(+)